MDDVPLATIGKLLGHVLPETTAKYAHLADEIVADAAKRISGSLANSLGLHALPRWGSSGSSRRRRRGSALTST